MTKQIFECSSCWKDVPDSVAVDCNGCDDGCDHVYCSKACLQHYLEQGDVNIDLYGERQLEKYEKGELK